MSQQVVDVLRTSLTKEKSCTNGPDCRNDIYRNCLSESSSILRSILYIINLAYVLETMYAALIGEGQNNSSYSEKTYQTKESLSIYYL